MSTFSTTGAKDASYNQLVDILKYGVDTLLSSAESIIEDTDLDLMLGPTVDGKWLSAAQSESTSTDEASTVEADEHEDAEHNDHETDGKDHTHVKHAKHPRRKSAESVPHATTTSSTASTSAITATTATTASESQPAKHVMEVKDDEEEEGAETEAEDNIYMYMGTDYSKEKKHADDDAFDHLVRFGVNEKVIAFSCRFGLFGCRSGYFCESSA